MFFYYLSDFITNFRGSNNVVLPIVRVGFVISNNFHAKNFQSDGNRVPTT